MPIDIVPTPEVQNDLGMDPPPTSTCAESAEDLLKASSASLAPNVQNALQHPILESSFADLTHDNPVVPYGNGFINGAIIACQHDVHLRLRPDDIWFAILTQFSTHLNANDEMLRNTFFYNGDKRLLKVHVPSSGSIFGKLDKDLLAQRMIELLSRNLADTDLHNWIMPDFSTTTDIDKSVAAILMLGTHQKLSGYSAQLGGCGFPSLTLLGEKRDWEKILWRIDKLSSFGDEPSRWKTLLVPVIQRMISTFDHPESEDTRDFWRKLAYKECQGGIGDIEIISGWITAFCWWTEGGKCPGKGIQLDGIQYHTIKRSSVPKSFASVHMTVEVWGAKLQYETTVIAGSVGCGLKYSAHIVNNDTLPYTDNGTFIYKRREFQPRSGWWILENSRTNLLEPENPELKKTNAIALVDDGEISEID